LRRWWLGSGAAAASAAVALVVILLVGGSSSSPTVSDLSGSARTIAPAVTAPGSHASSSAAASSTTAASGSSAASSPVPGPATTGRQVVQSAQLELSARPGRIENVAQQVFDVIGTEKGIVNSSHVTSAGQVGSYASFALSVPSAALAPTMSALSELRDANVISRTDATSDITGQVGGAGRRLAEARALQRSLLKQLAAATTPGQVASLKLRLHNADASIDSAMGRLAGLHRQVAYSNITLTIQAASAPVSSKTGNGPFTLSRAAHDAGRVLVVAAGVALIACAVLVPVGLAVALVAWALSAIRRRRREQALDVL
jgi:hypothetical protein